VRWNRELELLRHLGLARPFLKIHRYVTFGLALQAGVAHGSEPSLCLTVIFKPTVFHRLMKALAYVVKNDPGFLIARNGKTEAIGTTVSRHPATSAGIANIAEFPQFDF
jgi:hypothetical protein